METSNDVVELEWSYGETFFQAEHRITEFSIHLGNVLATMYDNGTILSLSDYFPFGLAMEERTYRSKEYRYGFNGKENDTDLSGSQLIHDYGFRVYNPVIGKFLSVDPLTKSYPWYTPYQFAGNTPIQAIDLDGLEEYKINNSDWFIGRILVDVALMNPKDDYIALKNKLFSWSGNSNGAIQLVDPDAQFSLRTDDENGNEYILLDSEVPQKLATWDKKLIDSKLEKQFRDNQDRILVESTHDADEKVTLRLFMVICMLMLHL
ncbi:RHS repeat domain-containing protein [Flammeovirga kamogawensis]|uniref:RHS repeat-associated core domain-containing protein n=1 Tax=Flammeovirga kamogawensis TaxID=373891 RepID=A0ABX8H334_9BACT|nr:RHS repeat-associated core domain-containing protein [Flammeovirga kamogawensis]MBB6463779.1 RHS repeat-associated protein [Flammeovirga kamogawensis]QWG09712.1 RHS repeat-associated core domain-containing protein [Flammeovirga kamogawensis]TRX65224.1 RHS repeat-associated core domain-containing protein [Flammeovirga kamogawensis]